jgi:hypothetical protein
MGVRKKQYKTDCRFQYLRLKTGGIYKGSYFTNQVLKFKSYYIEKRNTSLAKRYKLNIHSLLTKED